MFKGPVGIKTEVHKTTNVHFYYPSVFHGTNLLAQGAMNYRIFDTVIKLSNALVVPDLPTIITGSYDIKNNQKGVFSLSLVGLADFKGAHPMTAIKSLNFNSDTGRDYKFSELFKPDSNYLEVLSEMVLVQLKKQELPLFDEYPGIQPDQDYYVADKSLVIYFQLYEVAPYYVGFPYAVIPIYDIKDLIVENGLLSKLIEFT